MATTLPHMSQDTGAPIREIQTATLRYYESNQTITFSATKAIRAAGLEDGGSFRYVPEMKDEFGMLPALGSPEEADGRSDPLTSRIQHRGTDGKTKALNVPRACLEVLIEDMPDINSADDIDWKADPPEISIWAGPELLALGIPEERRMSVDRDALSLANAESESGDEPAPEADADTNHESGGENDA